MRNDSGLDQGGCPGGGWLGGRAWHILDVWVRGGGIIKDEACVGARAAGRGLHLCATLPQPCPSLGVSWVRGLGAVLVAEERGQEGGLFHSSPLTLKCVSSIMGSTFFPLFNLSLAFPSLQSAAIARTAGPCLVHRPGRGVGEARGGPAPGCQDARSCVVTARRAYHS